MTNQMIQYLKSGGVLPAIIITLILITVWNVTTAGASSLIKPLMARPPPAMISYQGVVNIAREPYNGDGFFKFAIVDTPTGNGNAVYWANETLVNNEPGQSITLLVSNSLFNVLLGDTSLPNMSQPLNPAVFAESETYLRVWFSPDAGGPFTALEPNQRITSVAYALRASYAENSLGSLTCTTNQIAKFDGNTWVCADSNGGEGSTAPTTPWQVFSSGGAASTNGTISLNGSFGQTVSGPAAGGEVTLGVGYWYGISGGPDKPPPNYQIYLPVVVKAAVE